MGAGGSGREEAGGGGGGGIGTTRTMGGSVGNPVERESELS